MGDVTKRVTWGDQVPQVPQDDAILPVTDNTTRRTSDTKSTLPDTSKDSPFLENHLEALKSILKGNLSIQHKKIKPLIHQIRREIPNISEAQILTLITQASLPKDPEVQNSLVKTIAMAMMHLIQTKIPRGELLTKKSIDAHLPQLDKIYLELEKITMVPDLKSEMSKTARKVVSLPLAIAAGIPALTVYPLQFAALAIAQKANWSEKTRRRIAYGSSTGTSVIAVSRQYHSLAKEGSTQSSNVGVQIVYEALNDAIKNERKFDYWIKLLKNKKPFPGLTLNPTLKPTIKLKS